MRGHNPTRTRVYVTARPTFVPSGYVIKILLIVICILLNRVIAFFIANLSTQTKTVWDDRPGTFTKQDIEDICIAAITLSGPTTGGQFAIQTKFGKKICVKHLATKQNTPSCFPVGIHTATEAIGQPCKGSSNTADANTVAVPP